MSHYKAFSMCLALVCALLWPGVVLAQLDICGCIGHPTLGAFDAGNDTTFVSSGATRVGVTVTIPLPDDGVLIFTSFTVPFNRVVRFARNAVNTPVTLLVSGDVTVASGGSINVEGDDGTNGSAGVNGVGGLGGHGAFPGGDGAYPLVNFATNGGPGVGPGGGSGGTATPLAAGSPGTFVSVPELLPLVGGSGGGGGASNSTASSCSGGGGGGGGGALLIAANGTMTVNGTIVADGGDGSSPALASCASRGHGGSGGAIRLLASTIAGTGSLFARGGFLQCCFGARAGAGAIRMEAFSNTMSATNTDPVATRAPAPGPLINPVMPTVEITQVGGQTVPTPPQGIVRGVDVILPAPGPVTIRLATSGVPSGTTLNVSVKPRVGGPPIQQSTTLAPANCTTAGDCDISVVVNLPAGAHVIEAQATFQP